MKLTTVIILGCFCAIFASENEIFDYSGYKVYQIFPTTVEEVKSLLQFRDDPMYDFWSEPKSLNVSTNIMVAPEVQTGFERYLTETKLNFKVLIEDVEVTVQNESVRQKAFSTRASSTRAGVSFERFMRIAEARLWRKTRSPHTICTGVDANRNFGYHWMENGASSWQCSETYAGPSAFSEVEARAVRDFLLANKDDIKLYINLHSYGNYLLDPWSYAAVLADDKDERLALATAVDKAMTAAGSDPYEIGTPPNVLYEAAGGSIDWVKGVAGIGVVQQTWEGFRVFGQYIDAKFGGN